MLLSWHSSVDIHNASSFPISISNQFCCYICDLCTIWCIILLHIGHYVAPEATEESSERRTRKQKCTWTSFWTCWKDCTSCLHSACDLKILHDGCAFLPFVYVFLMTLLQSPQPPLHPKNRKGHTIQEGFFGVTVCGFSGGRVGWGPGILMP